ncbi:hypothetical protein RhiirC2_789284 [Rhizophagus irregularis]|uniref:F-box/LRR-repeat protein 15-like leucin rich repeat domain-containing protein n=1 Tax=Rhizophagus irregularis TaxID=588596 RepID=A0A2N1MNG4_9GLOM|nr:hypothetical protein RhiirC2_789284 [Rhizophagus irregularis]
MALALPELLKNVFNFLAKDNALYPTLLISRLWSRCTGPILWIISQVYPNLIHLNVSNNGGLTDHSITKITKKCDKLQFLDIGFSGDITGKSFCEIAWSCNELKHLGINSCPNLRSLKLVYCDGINDIAIRKIAHCHYLEHLELYSIKALSDKSICIIARSCPDIQYLNLQFCNITDKAVEEIALSCHNLKHLDLFGALHISDLSISKIVKMCPNIIYLDLGYADFIFDRTLKIITEYLHSLEYLGLKGCRRISQKIINMLFPDLKIGGYYSLPLGR